MKGLLGHTNTYKIYKKEFDTKLVEILEEEDEEKRRNLLSEFRSNNIFKFIGKKEGSKYGGDVRKNLIEKIFTTTDPLTINIKDRVLINYNKYYKIFDQKLSEIVSERDLTKRVDLLKQFRKDERFRIILEKEKKNTSHQRKRNILSDIFNDKKPVENIDIGGILAGGNMNTVLVLEHNTILNSLENRDNNDMILESLGLLDKNEINQIIIDNLDLNNPYSDILISNIYHDNNKLLKGGADPFGQTGTAGDQDLEGVLYAMGVATQHM